MLRTIWAYIFAGFQTIVCSLASIAVGIFNPFSETVNRVIRFWAKSILKVAGVKVKVYGKEKLNPDQPYIFIANHQGTFDILAGVVSIPGTMRFIAKKELFRVPIFAQGMRAVGMIPIDRGNSKEARKTINEAVETLQKGVSVLIFPEGTRSETGEIKPFKKGGFILALKSGLPIVPMVFSGSLQIMKKKSKRLNRGTIHVYFLDPVDTTKYSFETRNELIANVREQIINHYRKISKE
ncbi:MAG: 1-acyl-sn-glycerol-3-phosphate acyltransferase [Calditrichaeota bacterium]|nr:1-acyl-sn-glycerol-3-phosphate acyltransferase [Calditrichota bacterium]